MQKSVLITGINGGIGKAIASKFLHNDYKVFGTDIGSQVSDCHEYFDIDLNEYASDSEYRNKINDKLLNSISQLNVLINNAAVQILGSLDEIHLSDWQKTMNVNLTAPFLLCQTFSKMLTSSKGNVINISSIHSQLTKKSFIAYATSKSGLTGMTKTLALDCGNRFRTNAIAPAAISTPMLKAGFEGKLDKFNELEKYHPTQSIGTPEQVASLAFFIANDANQFLNGSIISLDGGISSTLHDPE